jgi:galactoside O-acetyltransferase
MWIVRDDGVRSEMTSRDDFTRARMNNGQLYVDQGEGLEALEAERTHGKELLYDFNHTRPGQHEERLRLLRELLGAVGESVWIEPPFLAAYGSHI